MRPTMTLLVARDDMLFPSTGEEVLSLVIHLFGISILSFLLAFKVSRMQDLSSLYGPGQLNFPRLLILLLLIDSWAFLFSSAVILHGIGVELHLSVCTAAIYVCMGFYCMSKILIYLFLAERIHIVMSPPTRGRFRSPVYLSCFTAVCAYAAVVVLVILSKIAYYRSDGRCVTGIGSPGDIPLLVYDFFINILFTSLFLWPLLRSKCRSAYIHQLAKQNLWAAAVALSTSCINILVLLLMHGKQLGWICLGSCGVDIVINAMVMYWVTNGPSRSTAMQATPNNVNNVENEKPSQRDPRSLVVLTSLDGVEGAAHSSSGAKFGLPVHFSFGSTSGSEGEGEQQVVSIGSGFTDAHSYAATTDRADSVGELSPVRSERSHARSPSRTAIGALTSLLRDSSVRDPKVQDVQISITTTTEQDIDPPPGELPR